MRKTRTKSSESGIALLLAIFTLLLLAALGLALLCAADLETTIAANYRDKQVSIYGAMSGLQEARDRLIPSRCQNITPPYGICAEDPVAINTLTLGKPTLYPSAGKPYVVYIINPFNSEDIEPWSLGSKYFDSELCQEKAMIQAGICSPGGIPSGASWFQDPTNSAYSFFNDADSNAGEYHTSHTPLSFKWVRVMAKTDNMTSAYAQGASSNGSVMCWDGSHQVPATTTPPGYNDTCTTDSHSLMLYSGPVVCSLPNYATCTFNPPLGSGYADDHPDITITAPIHGGTQATAKAHATLTAADQVSAITVTNPGSNYTGTPTVTISAPPSGTTALAVATVIPVNGKSVTGFSSVTQTNPIGCYATTPTVSFSGGGGTGAAATANMSGTTCIAGWTVALTNNCNKGKYTVSAVGGTGSGFQGAIEIAATNDKGTKTAYISGTPTVTNPGSGYATSPSGITGADTCTFTTQWVLGKQVQSLSLTNGGSGYTSAPTVTLSLPTAPSGTNPPSVTSVLGAVSADAGKVLSIAVTNPGSGYTTAPTVTLSGGGGTGATATATLSPTYKIDSITLTNAGSGYTSDDAPTVSVGGGANVYAELAPVTQLGRVYILTALAVSQGGSKTLTQMEVATPPTNPFPTSMPAALTLDAPKVNINPASSNNYVINGKDANSDGGTGMGTKPAVGVLDDPSNPTSPTTQSCITSVLGGAQVPGCSMTPGVKSNNYIGTANSPNVENVWGQLGSLTTVAGADALANAIASRADYTDISPASLVSSGQMKYNPSSPMSSTCPTVVVNGDLTLTGNGTYCGVLLVTGNLTLQGNYTWYGPIFVIGTGGTFTGGGGGNGQIVGSLLVAQTRNADGTVRSTLGTPTVSFQILGGGGNGIQYDSAWSDRLLQNLSQEASYSSKPLKVISVRNIY